MSLLKKIGTKFLYVLLCSICLTAIIGLLLFAFFSTIPPGGMVSVAVESKPFDIPAKQMDGRIKAKSISIRVNDAKISMPVSFTADDHYYDVSEGFYTLIPNQNIIKSAENQSNTGFPEIRLTTENDYFMFENMHCESFQVNGDEIVFYLGMDETDLISIYVPFGQFKVEVVNCPNAYIQNEAKKKVPIQSFESDAILMIRPVNYVMDIHRPVVWINAQGEKDISFSEFDHFSNNGQGRVSLYKSATAQQYDYRGELEIQGKLNARLIDDELTVSGDVENLTIMGRSAFPGFINWLNDSVYVIPSMILTIIGGAIAMAGQINNLSEKKDRGEPSLQDEHAVHSNGIKQEKSVGTSPESDQELPPDQVEHTDINSCDGGEEGINP